MDDPVDLKREHHWFSYKCGREDGRAAGFEDDPNAFREGHWGFPAKVPTNPGFHYIDVVPQAYQKGYEEGYPEGAADRQSLADLHPAGPQSPA